MSDNDFSDLETTLCEYAISYIEEYNRLCGSLEQIGLPASLYSDRIVRAEVVKAKDGVVIFYQNSEMHKLCLEWYGEALEGAFISDYSEHDLSYIIQSASRNLIKLIVRSMGQSVQEPPSLVDDIELDPGMSMINTNILKPYIENTKYSDHVLNLIGIAVGRNWSFKASLFDTPLPCRVRIFTPFVQVPPNNVPMLQFSFAFCDIIWDADQLTLDSDAAKDYARQDIDILRLGMRFGLSPKELTEDPFEAVAQHCESACNQLRDLVDSQETKEEEVQAFLEEDRNKFLLCPQASQITPQKSLGGYKYRIDFSMRRPDGDYHLIEIESPNNPIYQKKGEEPTSQFNHAIQQVEDWFSYIERNLATVQNEDDFPGIYRPSGEVIIGRDRHLGEVARKRFDYKRAANTRIYLKTYDMIIEQGLAYAATLRSMRGTR